MNLFDLIADLRDANRVYIQPHNYPDHDAVASAFGLQDFLGQLGVAARIIYDGDIQRESLWRMIEELGIDIERNTPGLVREQDTIVVVDGCKGNRNVTDLAGHEIAVIDHHKVASPEGVPYQDIRPECGACATIIYGYYQAMQKPIPRKVATALMIAINMDTALLTRGVSQPDIQAFADLFTQADIGLQNSILRNFIQTKDLDFYRHAIDNIRIENTVAFCHFPEGCDQNLLGILGDFFLALREVDFVILCAENRGVVNFSLRNERAEWDASFIVQDALRGIGFGGGHQNMAGGIIKDAAHFHEETIRGRFLEKLREAS